MLAAFCTQPGSLDLRDVPMPQPGVDEVLVKVRNCGICGSDLHFYQGAAPPPHVCLGHEIGGEVAAVGTDVTRVRCGDAVAVEPLVVCRGCDYCRAGNYQLCAQLRILGFSRNGGFAEYVVVPDYTLYRLPPTVDCTLGALAEPLAVGVHAVRLANIEATDHVLVLGAGTIGLLAIASAKAAGATEVWATARHSHQAAAAHALGATRVFPAGDSAEALRASTGRDVVDVVIETVGGRADTIDAAIQCVRPGGRVVVLGVFSTKPMIDALALMAKEVRLVGSMTYSRSYARTDFAMALQLLGAQPDHFRHVITHRVGLHDIARGFALAGNKTSGSIKVMVGPEL